MRNYYTTIDQNGTTLVIIILSAIRSSEDATYTAKVYNSPSTTEKSVNDERFRVNSNNYKGYVKDALIDFYNRINPSNTDNQILYI